jgi:predicted enzyme related to lactoylglutathione lyase
MADALGKAGWIDITTEDAGALKDFYREVCDWGEQSFDMGGYDDYVMLDTAGEAVGGICHGRGANAAVPTGWMVYFTVASMDDAVAAATKGGGTVVDGPRTAGGGTMAIVRDPAGNHFALYQS